MTQEETMESRFDQIKGFRVGWIPEYKEAILSFIRSEIALAQKQQRKEIYQYILSMIRCRIPEPICSMHKTHNIEDFFSSLVKETL